MSAPGVAARQLAVDALVRIDSGGAYANLTLPPMLERSGLSDRDRAFVTELVYGTTRMQRSCDWLVDRFLPDPGRVDATARRGCASVPSSWRSSTRLPTPRSAPPSSRRRRS